MSRRNWTLLMQRYIKGKCLSYEIDYLWAKISFNDIYKYDTSINHDAVAAHEIGHVLGLPHNSSVYSIMYAYSNGSVAIKPAKVDSDRVTEIYGGY